VSVVDSVVATVVHLSLVADCHVAEWSDRRPATIRTGKPTRWANAPHSTNVAPNLRLIYGALHLPWRAVPWD